MTISENSTDPVLRLALRIARRADEIGQHVSKTPDDLSPWLRAEEEVLGMQLPVPALRTAVRPMPQTHRNDVVARCSCYS
jgi:hypothetical protein